MLSPDQPIKSGPLSSEEIWDYEGFFIGRPDFNGNRGSVSNIQREVRTKR